MAATERWETDLLMILMTERCRTSYRELKIARSLAIVILAKSRVKKETHMKLIFRGEISGCSLLILPTPSNIAVESGQAIFIIMSVISYSQNRFRYA